MQNLEKYNHNMANQMLTILNSLIENIVNLGGKLKAWGYLVEKYGKDKGKEKIEEDTIMDITQSHLDQSYENN